MNNIRRTNKYDQMDDASYEALMASRNIYPYMNIRIEDQVKNQGLGMTEIKSWM